MMPTTKSQSEHRPADAEKPVASPSDLQPGSCVPTEQPTKLPTRSTASHMQQPGSQRTPELLGSPLVFDSSRAHATLTFMRGSVISLSIALLAGLLGVLYYIPAFAPTMQRLGINFTSLRPIHTTFAAAFIFLGGLAVVHRYFEDIAPPMRTPERIRSRTQVMLWALAGLGILITLLGQVFSGREYLGFHPSLAILIALGWMLFAWNAIGHFRRGFFSRPVFIFMWTVSLFFFLYTFAEQYAWLLGRVFNDPILDLRLQWKATGTLVGSFNLLVYGSLYYIGTKRTGDDSPVHSNLAYALFAVGLLNSFTNFGHHTYHLPQSHIVKWISFVISMTEIIILTRVVWDITASISKQSQRAGEDATNTACERGTDATVLFMRSAKWWTAWILASALVISIPPLNALIHGTTAVMGHAMGAEIGIDSMILFAALTWIISESATRRGIDASVLHSRSLARTIIGLNIATALLVGWLSLTGTLTGIYRYNGQAAPAWLDTFSHPIMALAGAFAAWFLGCLLFTLLRLLFAKPAKSTRRK